MALLFYSEAIVDHLGVSVIMLELGAAWLVAERRDTAPNKLFAEVLECRNELWGNWPNT